MNESEPLKIQAVQELPPPLSLSECTSIWLEFHKRISEERIESKFTLNPHDLLTKTERELYEAVAIRLLHGALIERITVQEAVLPE